MHAREAAAASARVMAAVRARVARGELAAAEQELLAHLRTWREDARALHALAGILIETGREPVAVRVMETLLALEPLEPQHYLTLAALLDANGRRTELLPLYERMCAALPAHATAHFNRACALRSSGRDDEALAAHHRALALGIERPEIGRAHV